VYKTPGGYKFAYTDPNTPIEENTPLKMFARDMDDNADPIALTRTLQSIADTTNATGTGGAGATTPPSFFLYNDEPDVGTASSTYGHTKGVVAEGGFWIVHSTPKFPASNGKSAFFFPETEIIYGQTFLCISLTKAQVDDVGKQLLFTRPFLYHATNAFASSAAATAAGYPHLADVLDKKWNTGTGDAGTSTVPLGGSFVSLAKNKEWDDDIYENLVAKHYATSLLVETWIRGEALGAYCPPAHEYQVVDAQSLYVTEGGANVTWTETQDHAKWAVGLDASSSLVCIADINRMSSQRKRGGQAMCFSDKGLAYSMRNTVYKRSSCTAPTGPTPAPPAPTPSSPTPAPAPTPSGGGGGTCCFSSDASCAAGQVCCTSKCTTPASCSYTKAGCDGAYGQKHHCVWDAATSVCSVGSAA
jgi:deoxyribonuclease-2